MIGNPPFLGGKLLIGGLGEDYVSRMIAAWRKQLKARTLTKLYNARPQWFADAHADLDAVVAAAYGWDAAISEEEALARLLEMNASA